MSNKINIIKQTEGTVYGYVGKELTLRIAVSTQDFKKYIVEWRRNGVSVPAEQIEEGSNFLYIPQFQEAQAGIYQARVKLVENPQEYVDSKPITVVRKLWIAPEEQSDTHIEKRLGEELRLFATAAVEEDKHSSKQWFRNHIPIESNKVEQQSGNVHIPRVTYADFGNYTCKVSLVEDPDSFYWINPIVVEQNKKPAVFTITEHYQDKLTVLQDARLNLSVQVKSDNTVDPISYTWVHNGHIVPGENGSAMHKEHAELSDAGVWRLRIEQGNSVAFSKDCVVSVTGQSFFRISKQPLNDNEPTGGRAEFSLDYATTYDNVKIQWLRKKTGEPEFSPLIGETKKILGVVPVTAELNNSKYKARITYGSNQAVETDEATLLAGETIAISITKQPEAITNARVSSARMLECLATSNYPDFPLDYQWYRNNQLLLGQTKAQIHFPSITKADEGSYKCVVSTGVQNHRITKESDAVNVTVDDSQSTLDITVQPKAVKVRAGGQWKLTVEATTNDAYPPRYRWYKDGEEIFPSGVEQKNFYGEDHAQPDSTGVYACRVSAGFGSHRVTKTSEAVRVIVTDDPAIVPNDTRITIQPQDKHVQFNEKILLHAKATNTIGIEPKYQWYHDDKVIPGATGETLVIDHAKQSDIGVYHAKITAAEFEEESNPALISMDHHTNINIIKHPIDVVAKEGAGAKDIVLEAHAEHVDDEQDVKYQWHVIQKGVDKKINGATEKTYVIRKSEVSKDKHAGTYYAEITDDNGHAKQTEKIRVVFTTAKLKRYVHPIPWRNTSFQYQGYWVMDEIDRCNRVGLDWLEHFAETKYPDEIETIAASLHFYSNTGILESRNGYLVDGTRLF